MNNALRTILNMNFSTDTHPKWAIPNFPVVTLGCSIPEGANHCIVPVVMKNAPCIVIGPGEGSHYIRAFSYHDMAPHPVPRTVSSLMGHLYSDADGELVKVTTPKGYTYYGTAGVIFNDQLEPLLLAAHWTRNMGAVEERLTLSTCNLLLVDSRVLINKDILSKAIVKDFIPYYRVFAIDTLFTNLRRYVIQSSMVDQERVQNEVTVLSDIISRNL